jgi:hypothetical protein
MKIMKPQFNLRVQPQGCVPANIFEGISGLSGQRGGEQG